MPYEIIRTDITNLPYPIDPVDAIINTANTNPKHGLGLDAAIFKKAGPKLKERRKEFIGEIAEGSVVATPPFDLKNRVKRVLIHTVAPVWRGGDYQEEVILKQCYDNSLQEAKRYGCTSIAVPLIGSGNLGFPKTVALKIAINAIMDFCFREINIQIYLVLFDRESVDTAKMLQENIAEYIDDSGVSLTSAEEYLRYDGIVVPVKETHSIIRKSREEANRKKDGFDDILFRQDSNIGFSETLLKLIKTTGEKNYKVYQRADINKEHFAKIKANKEYKTSKDTALRLAVTLELDVNQASELLRRAGYLFPDPTDPVDDIVLRNIVKGNFNIVKIQSELIREGLSFINKKIIKKDE